MTSKSATNENGPASAPTLPSLGSSNPAKDQNMKEDSTAAANAAIPPSTEDWRGAFLAVEDQVLRIESIAKITRYLAGWLHDDAENEIKNKNLGFVKLAEVTALSALLLVDATKDADKAYYAAFNDLIGRENEDLKRRAA